jgi:hypothetical protein
MQQEASTMQSAIFSDGSSYRESTPQGWTLIAAIDESQPYEVDVTEIFRTSEGFALVTASGCSCWDGAYQVETFITLEGLGESIDVHSTTDRAYNPSVRGAQDLMRMAREA